MKKANAKMRSITAIVGLAAFFAAGSAASAADGGELFKAKGCVACHGPTGNKATVPNYPNLAGQNPKYLVDQMKLIKSGARGSGQTAVMKPIIANVSEDEMIAMADWLSKQSCK